MSYLLLLLSIIIRSTGDNQTTIRPLKKTSQTKVAMVWFKIFKKMMRSLKKIAAKTWIIVILLSKKIMMMLFKKRLL